MWHCENTMNNNEEAAGRRPSKLSAALQNAVTATHIFLYRLSRGAIGGRMANSPVLLLTTTGHKSGRRRTVPLLYLKDQDDFVLVPRTEGLHGIRHGIATCRPIPTWKSKSLE
jgi:hypothetical protein